MRVNDLILAFLIVSLDIFRANLNPDGISYINDDK